MLIGPSASGKTTLARLIMGLWPAYSGKVRLDGVDVFNWDKNQLGPYLGYLPQTVELFDGTVAENVARFGVVDLKEVERVIEQVGLMGLINSLPDGLSTRIGEDGSILSGGQRQRVALARAIYGRPKLIVLDEPNSNLDEAGEVALLSTLANLKKQGASVLVITHRTSVLPQADKLLMLREGQVFLFGPRDEVLAALQKAQNENQPNQVSKPSATQAQQPPAGVASPNNSNQSGTPSKTKTMTVSAVPMGVGVSMPKAAAIVKASSEGESK
jgi:ATP-binding cassette subfamily C exporter for protease/lipase